MIRPFTESDYNQVAAIYQEGINTGIATFETQVPEWDKWDEAHLPFGRLGYYNEDTLFGWAALSPVSNRCVYGGVAEVSIYIHPASRGKEIGKTLLLALIVESEKNEIWTLQSSMFDDNIASQKLHQSCGFRKVGFREKIGQLDGKWYDNILFERRSKSVGQ